MRRIDASTERRLADGFARALRRPGMRETLGSALFAALMLLGAVALAPRAPAARELDAAARARLHGRARGARARGVLRGRRLRGRHAGRSSCRCCCCCRRRSCRCSAPLAFLLSSLGDALRGRSIARARAARARGDAWFALAPGARADRARRAGARLGALAGYALALAAQLAVEAVVTVARVRLVPRDRPRATLSELGVVFRVDALLAPLGLLAAIAAPRCRPPRCSCSPPSR